MKVDDYNHTIIRIIIQYYYHANSYECSWVQWIHTLVLQTVFGLKFVKVSGRIGTLFNFGAVQLLCEPFWI